MNRLLFTMLIAAGAVGLSALPALFPGASPRPVAVANIVIAPARGSAHSGRRSDGAREER